MPREEWGLPQGKKQLASRCIVGTGRRVSAVRCQSAIERGRDGRRVEPWAWEIAQGRRVRQDRRAARRASPWWVLAEDPVSSKPRLSAMRQASGPSRPSGAPKPEWLGSTGLRRDAARTGPLIRASRSKSCSIRSATGETCCLMWLRSHARTANKVPAIKPSPLLPGGVRSLRWDGRSR